MADLIRVVAVDDEFPALQVIERYVKKVPFLEWVKGYTSPLELLKEIETQEVDLVFLDINMPELSGTSLAKVLKGQKRIVFTTAYSEFAVEGFDLNALDYLVKPIEFERFLEAAMKAKEWKTSGAEITSNDPILSIKSSNSTHRFKSNELLYLEKQGNYMIFHLPGRKIQSRMNMKDIFELLDPNAFCQVHKSFLVAVDKVEMVESHQLTIQGCTIPIGRSFISIINERFKS